MKKIIYSLLAVVLLVAFAAAQTPTGKIVGKVKDDQGVGLPGVTVEATSPKMVGKSAVVSDETGTYRLFSLPSGVYTITYTLQGFQPIKREGVVLQLEQTIALDVTLKQSPQVEQITVIGQSPLIDVKSTTKGSTMTKDIFLSLPRNRDFTGLLTTVPGVNYAYEPNTGGMSVDGATGIENMWYMDGANVTGAHLGNKVQSAAMELVEEVKLTASGYNAEFGGSMGGVVNVITRSGGNAFHGDFFGFFENNSLLMQGKTHQYVRQNPYDDQLYEWVNDDDLYYNGGKDRDPYARYEGVFSLGGYIIKDKLWFFGSFNPVYELTKRQAYFRPADVSTKTEFTQERWNWNGAIKLSAMPVNGMRISASFVNNFSKYLGNLPSRDGISDAGYPWAKEGLSYPDMSAAATIDYSINNNFLLSLRGGWGYTNTNDQQTVNPSSIYTFARANTGYKDIPTSLMRDRNWTNWSGDWSNYKKTIAQKLSTNLDFTYYMELAGEHAWKAGVQLVRMSEDYDRTADHPRVTLNWTQTCTALEQYPDGFKGKYGYYQVRGSYTSPYGYFWDMHSNNWALYLQDSWTINGRLTVNLGLRTEYEYIPSFSKDPLYKDVIPITFNFADKLAPRFGAIYDVFGDSSLKVFGSFGIYYDVMKLYIAEGSFGGFKWKTDYYTLDNYDWTKIAASGKIDDQASQAAGGKYMGTYDWRVPTFDTTDPNLMPVNQSELSLGLEKKLLEDLSLSVRFVKKHLIHTIEDVGVAVVGLGEVYYSTNPGFGSSLPTTEGGNFDPSLWATPKAKRDYYGVNVSLEKRFSNNWFGGFNYTWSRAEGNYGGLASTDEAGRLGPNTERYFDLWFMSYKMNGDPLDGPLAQDRTHYFKAYGSYAFPFGLTVSLTGYGRSGLPMSTRLDIKNAYMYPNGYGDLGRAPFTFWSDLYLEYTLRIAKKYSVGINLQINNWTNTKTYTGFSQAPTRIAVPATNAEILSKTFDWQSKVKNYDPNPIFNTFTSEFGSWSARLGLKFNF